MQPQSIGRLSTYYSLLIGILILAVIAHAWTEVERLSVDIRARETQAARKEVADAFASIGKKIKDASQALAHWDETKQQLSYSEFYAIWRDTRVRDAGIIPGATLPAVALYDKHGNILNNAPGPDPMPLKLPGAAPLSQFRQEHGRGHLYHFAPVYADASNSFLLGYVGLKLNLLDELKQARSYSYADLASLRITLPENTPVSMERLLRHLQIRPRPNPAIDTFSELFRASQMRQSLVVLSMLLLATWLLNRLVVRPLRQLSDEINTLRDNPDHSLAGEIIRTTPLPVQELENVRTSFNEYLARLTKLHAHMEENSQSLYDQARHDALTGACNRRAFDEDWKGLGEDRRLGRVALLLFDCDHFKAINDTYGHQVGDKVIQSIAGALHEALRAADRLYRLGGDEFATILLEADASRAELVAERCIAYVLAQDFRQYGMSEPTTISIGIALSEGEGVTLHELQKRADLAMYTAKRPGSRKLVFYSADMGGMAALVGNKEISAVFQAIENPDWIELHYQSVMRLPIATKEYVEALARIRIDGELIGPGAIFPIVQERHLDMEFDLAVLRALDRDMTQGLLPAGQGVSVNLSAPSIVQTKVVDALIALIGAHRERKIVAEITETALITQIEIASSNIRRLREAGCLVALDDFGSGYSSLRYLTSMPVDLVKFDISMVRLLNSGDRRQQLMMEEIAGLVISAGYQMVAEGVDSRELLEKVVSLGFTHAQGYYFDQPQAPAPRSLSDFPRGTR